MLFLIIAGFILISSISSTVSAQTTGIWTSAPELSQLPMSGLAWQNLKSEADKPTGTPDLSDQNDKTNVRVLAKALVYARTGVESYRTAVIGACMAAIGTEAGGQTLALGRELLAYVIAADLVGLPPNNDAVFRDWLNTVRNENLQGRTLISTHEERPNNWGTHCGASRVAVAVYLNDQADLAQCAQVFKGWMGDRSSYAGFQYGSLAWQADPNNPVGINPAGSTKQGHSIDGVLPDDQRRSGGFSWPPPKANYVYEALQGALAQAVILYRAGYDVWNWEDQAMLRAFMWLHDEADYPAQGDDTWEPHLVNYFYNTSFPAPIPSSPGKNMGWTDWTHSGQNSGTFYVLTLNINGQGSVELNPPGGLYSPGTQVTLNAIPGPGYQFNGWSGSISGTTTPRTITMNSNMTVTAHFIPVSPQQYTLAINVIGAGDVQLDPPGGVYDPNTVVTLTAAAATGYEFDGWEGDLSGNANPETITMNSNKNVVARFINTGGGGGGNIVLEEIVTGGSSRSTIVETSGNLSGVSGHLYLAAISAKQNVTVNSVFGLGLTWIPVEIQCSGRNQTGMKIWMAQGTPNGNGVVTAVLANSPQNAVIAVSRYSGVNETSPIGQVISGNTNGYQGGCSGGSDTHIYSFDFSTSVNGAVVYSAVAIRNRHHTPGSGYMERVEFAAGSGGSAAGIAVQDRMVASASALTVNGTFDGNVDWAVVGVEIIPGAPAVNQYALNIEVFGNGTVALNPPGGVYNEGEVVTLTAIPNAGYTFNHWEGDLTGAANPATITMNSGKTVRAYFVESGGSGNIVYEETRVGGSTNSTNVSTTGQLTAVEGDLYLAAISMKGRVGVSSVAGLGLTWSFVGSQCAGRNQTGVEVWMAQGTPSGNGTVSAVLSSSPKNAVIAVSRYSGVDETNPLGTFISGNTNGLYGGCSGGSDEQQYSFGLTTNVGGSVVYCAVAIRNKTHNPGQNYTEREEFGFGSGGNRAGIAIQDRPVSSPATVAVNGSFSGTVDYAVIGLEIKPAQADDKPNPNPLVFNSDKTVALNSNFPNPFNPDTHIQFAVKSANHQVSRVRLTIYNILGMKVRELVNGYFAPGEYVRVWDSRDDGGREVAAGVYIYQVTAQSRDGLMNSREAKRMILVR